MNKLSEDTFNSVLGTPSDNSAPALQGSLEPVSGAAATLVTPAPVLNPAILLPLEMVDAVIESWFNASFPGSPIASPPGNWNILLGMKDNLKEVIRSHANSVK
jgi:hypothetical protein